MDSKTSAAILAIGLATVVAPEALAQRACQSLHDEKPRRGLPYSNGTVISEKVQFDHAQRAYFVKVFSETSRKGKSRFEQCFRYEAEAENEVRQFYWPLAGIRIETLRPGLEHRRSRRVVHDIDQDPRAVTNPVFAFENVAAKAKAWAPVTDVRKQTSNSREKYGFARFAVVAPDTVVFGLSQFFQLQKLPTSAPIAYYLGESGSSILLDTYSGPTFTIEVRSTATRKGSDVVVTTDIVPSGPTADKARYAMPAMRAIGQVKGPVTKLDSYETFVKAFGQVARESERYQAKWTFTRQIPLSYLAGGALFRVSHPVVIDRDGERDCFLAVSYSPLAVSFGLRDCPFVAR